VSHNWFNYKGFAPKRYPKAGLLRRTVSEQRPALAAQAIFLMGIG